MKASLLFWGRSGERKTRNSVEMILPSIHVIILHVTMWRLPYVRLSIILLCYRHTALTLPLPFICVWVCVGVYVCVRVCVRA